MPLTAILLIFLAQALPPRPAPGAVNPAVGQANIKRTICASNWTANVRPPASYTDKLKVSQIAQLGLPGKPEDYEEDHRIPLELGGHPTDERNLWPEPWKPPYGAHQKDRLENAIHRDVCKDRLSLSAAQAIFKGNWWPEYRRRFEKR